jgi:hypothetical protein
LQTPTRNSGARQAAGTHYGRHSSDPLLAQPQLSNSLLTEMLNSGGLQAKLRVSQPGDADEQEADRAANAVVSATHSPRIQRKCACGGSGSPCAKCQEEEQTIHRSAALPALSSSPLSLQRAPADDSAAHTPEATGNSPKPSPTPHHAHPLVVDDDAKTVGPHQMRKSAFIALLRADACATADAVLMSVGRSTKACPYIEKWLAFYEKQSADHIARAIVKYAPETAGARSAHEAIRLVVMRVLRATITWAKTGKISGLPEGLTEQATGKGFLGAVHDFASSSVGGGILGFIGGSAPAKAGADSKMEKPAAGSVARKADSGRGAAAPAHDAASVRSQLGGGHSLDSRVQSQMSSAFGHDFSGVRVHTDSRASALSSGLTARAFTIGTDVAFASGEYQPGTPVGDALIAHELAHVVQQSSATHSSAMAKGDGEYDALEQDADRSAVGAVASVWTQGRVGIKNLKHNLVPSLRSGLRLSRCKDDDKTAGLERLKVCMRPVRIAEDDGKNPTTLPSFQNAQRVWEKCCIDVSVSSAVTVAGTKYKEIDDAGSGAPLTAEERDLFKDAGPAGGCVNVAIVDTIRRGANAGKKVAGGATTKNAGSADAEVIAVDGVDSSIIAHELGHAMGYQRHDPAGTVMEPSGAPDKPVKEKMDLTICDEVRKYTGAGSSGKKGCSEST